MQKVRVEMFHGCGWPTVSSRVQSWDFSSVQEAEEFFDQIIGEHLQEGGVINDRWFHYAELKPDYDSPFWSELTIDTPHTLKVDK